MVCIRSLFLPRDPGTISIVISKIPIVLNIISQYCPVNHIFIGYSLLVRVTPMTFPENCLSEHTPRIDG